jgi:hypothetical protein
VNAGGNDPNLLAKNNEGRKPVGQRDEGFPNLPQGNPNFSERNPSRLEQNPNPAE